MTITTPTGFICEMAEDSLDDMEFLEILMEIQDDEKSKTIHLPKLISIMIGEEGKKALYEHCRDEKGKVRISRVSAEFEEIMKGASEAKKK